MTKDKHNWWGAAASQRLGFPIRAPSGHCVLGHSPKFIAAYHALHRLLLPRHPPFALRFVLGNYP